MVRTVLVTGCGGFIGFHVAKALLEQGTEVIGVDNLNSYYDPALKQARLDILQSFNSFTFYKQDIADLAGMTAIWNRHDIKHIVHLAAQAGVRHSLKHPFDYIHSNIQGLLVLLELCRHNPVQHLIYASSSSVYGSNTHLPFSPQDKTDTPVSLYAATKKANELMTHAYCHLYQIPATGLRFFTVYGPWGRPDMAAFLFAKAILAGEPIKVFNYGDMKRDFTYIDDIVSGVLNVLQVKRAPGEHKIYNLGNNLSVPLLSFIDTLESCLQRKAKRELLPLQDGDVPETYADITESINDFGFSPKTPIEEGIPKFIEWFLDYHKMAIAAA